LNNAASFTSQKCHLWHFCVAKPLFKRLLREENLQQSMQICNPIANLHAFGVFWLEIPCNFAMKQKTIRNAWGQSVHAMVVCESCRRVVNRESTRLKSTAKLHETVQLKICSAQQVIPIGMLNRGRPPSPFGLWREQGGGFSQMAGEG
jgi:hypothetical protein